MQEVCYGHTLVVRSATPSQNWNAEHCAVGVLLRVQLLAPPRERFARLRLRLCRYFVTHAMHAAPIEKRMFGQVLRCGSRQHVSLKRKMRVRAGQTIHIGMQQAPSNKYSTFVRSVLV